VRVVVDDNGIRQILASREARGFLLDAADPIIATARGLAPKRSGRGAGSIHSEALMDGPAWVVRVGWTGDRYYMKFQDQGWRYHRAGRHFMEIALEGAYP
jgi:hypothetical protein